MNNVQKVLGAVRKGQVDLATIELAQQALNEGVDEKYRTIVRAVAGANPAPRLSQSVNEVLQFLLKAENLDKKPTHRTSPRHKRKQRATV